MITCPTSTCGAPTAMAPTLWGCAAPLTAVSRRTYHTASQTTISGWGGFTGGVLGVTVAAGLGWAIFRGGRRLSLSRFFAATTVLLVLVAAGLFSTGIGKLIGLGVIPSGDVLWDTSGLLSDHSVVGGFLSGLAGYRARPTAPEVIGYAVYVLAAGLLLFSPRATAPATKAARPSAGALS